MLRIGKIVATHGLKGSMIVKHIVAREGWLDNGQVLMVEIRKGSHIPYFVEQVKDSNKEELNVTLEGVETVEEAKRLIGKHVYVTEDILGKESEDSPLMWIGFNMVDKVRGGIGAITDVMQAGKQWIASVDHNGNEVMVPLVEEIILDVNVKNRYLRVALPDGLIEVYTGTDNDED